MRLDIPDIYWHGPKDRILSLTFHPSGETLVTAGTVDSEGQKTFIRQWEINYDKGFDMSQEEKDNKKNHKNVKYLGDLTGGHESTVNCVRFSPNGKYLASCADDNSVIIWNLRRRVIEFGSDKTEITWCPFKILKSHTSGVYDLVWSRDSQYLVTGSIDNTAILWSVEKAKKIQILEGHKHYVQGVCIDPKFKYIVTLSSDRTAKIYKHAKTKKNVAFYHDATLKRLEYKKEAQNQQNLGCATPIKNNNMEEEEDVNNKDNKENPNHNISNSFSIFLDETLLNTFFRRLDWSPDGSFLLVPAARYKESADSETRTVVYVFRRGDLANPCFCIPTNGKPALCVRFCPKLFKKDTTNARNSVNMFDIPYKMVFAVATTDSILLYSTQSLVPVILVSNIIGNIHFAPLTDISWVGSKMMGVSSSDGYCSFMLFDKNDLGEELPIEDYDEELRKLMFPDYKTEEEEAEERKTAEEKTANTGMLIEETPKILVKAPETVPVSQPGSVPSASGSTIQIIGGKKKIVPKVLATFN